MRLSPRRLCLALAVAFTVGAPLAAQSAGGCAGGGGAGLAVASRVDATVLFEHCLAGDRIAAIVLWRRREPGWEGAPHGDSLLVRANLERAGSGIPPTLPSSSGANDRFGWLAALDRASGRVLVRTRDGDHAVPLAGSDSVLVVMVDGVDAVAGPVVITATQLAPASTAGILLSREQVREHLRTHTPLPRLDSANRLRSMLMLDGFSRRFIAD